MKKLMMLLAIVSVFFVGCEPTTGGDGLVLPAPIDETLQSKKISETEDWVIWHTISIYNGVAVERLYYISRSELNAETDDYENLEYFEIYTLSNEPNVYYIATTNWKKQDKAFTPIYWDDRTITTSEEEDLVSIEAGWFIRNDDPIDGFYYYGLVNNYTKTELYKIIASGTVTVNLTKKDTPENNLKFTVPVEFSEYIDDYF